MMMELINEGKFDIEGTNSKGILIKLQIRYTAKPKERPNPKTMTRITPKKENNKKKQEDLLEGLDFNF